MQFLYDELRARQLANIKKYKDVKIVVGAKYVFNKHIEVVVDSYDPESDTGVVRTVNSGMSFNRTGHFIRSRLKPANEDK